MALTATATIKSRETIIESLGMVTPYIISFLPDKPNKTSSREIKIAILFSIASWSSDDGKNLSLQNSKGCIIVGVLL